MRFGWCAVCDGGVGENHARSPFLRVSHHVWRDWHERVLHCARAAREVTCEPWASEATFHAVRAAAGADQDASDGASSSRGSVDCSNIR